MILIGISGKKRSGKDTAAQCIINCCDEKNAVIIRFADKLKEVVMNCFVPHELLHLDWEELKNIELPCKYTGRELLQRVGTEYFRGIWSDVWLNTYKKDIEQQRQYDSIMHQESVVITPDVRFPNEANYQKSQGGILIRLTKTVGMDNHESETAMDYYDGYDFIIDNQDMNVIEQNIAIQELVLREGLV